MERITPILDAFLEDQPKALLRTAELAATTIYRHKQRHYLLGSYVPVGEAITLAMKTHHTSNQQPL